jgi:hypothetical protein
VEREEQLRWERDSARWAAPAAFLSALLTVAASLYVRSKVTGSADDQVEGIVLVHGNKDVLLVSAILQGIGTIALAAVLYYLFRATRFRREALPRLLVYLVVLAPLVQGVVGIVRQVQINEVADRVFPSLPLPPDDGKALVDDELGEGGLLAVGAIGTAAGLGLAFAFLITSLNAMRAGLLSKFMGILGIIVGVLLVIPLGGNLPIVQIFWLVALGMLFLDRWPQGRGPAWETGEETPWPTAQDRRDALMGPGPDEPPREEPAERRPARTAGSQNGESPHAREPVRPRDVSTHPRSKKRKRKRRG